MMKVLKVLWIGMALFVLYVTIDGFHSTRDKDIWDVLTWLMLILSFPAGLAVSLVLWAFDAGLSITSKTSYISLVLGWAGYFILGYLQWFKLVPWIMGKVRTHSEKTDSLEKAP